MICEFLSNYNWNFKVFLCEILDTNRRGLGAAMYSVLHSLGFCMVLFSGTSSPLKKQKKNNFIRCIHTLANGDFHTNSYVSSNSCTCHNSSWIPRLVVKERKNTTNPWIFIRSRRYYIIVKGLQGVQKMKKVIQHVNGHFFGTPGILSIACCIIM